MLNPGKYAIEASLSTTKDTIKDDFWFEVDKEFCVISTSFNKSTFS